MSLLAATLVCVMPALPLAPVPFQSLDRPDLVELLLEANGPIPGYGPGSAIVHFGRIEVGRGGGWTVMVGGDDGMGDPNATAILGQRPSPIDGPAELLRGPGTFAGYVQGAVRAPSMASGQIAYLTAPTPTAFSSAAWVEDQRIVTAGDAVVGMPAWIWERFETIQISTNGEVLLSGLVDDGGLGAARGVLWSWPSGTVLLAERDFVPGLQRRISEFSPYVRVSPDGSHWATLATERVTGRDVVIVDGQVLEVGGLPVIEGEPVPETVVDPNQNFVWERLSSPPEINNAGEVLFSSELGPAGMGEIYFVRNGRRLDLPQSASNVVGIDSSGAVVSSGNTGSVMAFIEGHPLVLRHPLVDDNGDGIPEQNYEVLDPPNYNFIASDSQGLFMFKTDMLRDNMTVGQAIFRSRHYRAGQTVCEGAPNSTGSAGKRARQRGRNVVRTVLAP